MPDFKRFEEFKVGDLVRWREPMGGPPFLIHGGETYIMEDSYMGIVTDITYDGRAEIVTYMVRWQNGVLFPVFINEICMVAKGDKHDA